MLGLVFSLSSLFFFYLFTFYWHLLGLFFLFSFFVFLFYFCFFGSFCVFNLGIFVLDGLSFSLVFLSLWVGGLMILASYKVYYNRFFCSTFCFFVLSLVLVLVFCFCFSSFFSFYFFFELSLVPTLFLILGWGYQPERLQAGMYMMLYTIAASLPLLFVIFLEYSSFGSLSFFLYRSFSFSGGFVSFVWWVFFCLAFLVKVPLYFFHLWLPKAHVEAPVSGSMVLAGVLLKLGGYGLFRVLFFYNFFGLVFSVNFMVISLWGGVITGFICLRQVDVKSLIAYSSVGHMGLMVGGLFSGSVWGWYGALVMILSHGLCSSGLFCLANLNYELLGTRSLFLLKGMLTFLPSLSFWWFMFSAFNMAAPPSFNLFGELLLIISLLGHSSGWFLFLGFLSFLAGGYSLYLYTASQHGSFLSFYFPVFCLKQRNYLLLSLHLFPLFLIILKLESFLFWLV